MTPATASPSSLSDLFWAASVDELVEGVTYVAASEQYVCLVCGERFERGDVYAHGERWLEAAKAARLHVGAAHGSMFQHLLGLDKRVTGLTDHQKTLLGYFYEGRSDAETAEALGIGSTSTIRNHRFALREKEKQAKVHLALMGLLEREAAAPKAFMPIHRTATMVDERYAVTPDENAVILTKYFDAGLEGPLKSFPTQEKRKIVVLRQLATRFAPGRRYSEKEVNDVLRGAHEDFALLRRYLIQYGFLDRLADGSQYWLKV